jgi:tartrate dehydratase beta subunit/fumarate hydratase class I family protein
VIAVILVLVLAVAGVIWLRAAWVRIDTAEKERVADREQILILLEGTRLELLGQIELVVRDAAHIRLTHNGDYADLLQQLTDLREIEQGIVAYLDDVPQNFAFHKAGVTYTLRLPERLRMVLSREG